jgi:hypothetical protein
MPRFGRVRLTIATLFTKVRLSLDVVMLMKLVIRIKLLEALFKSQNHTLNPETTLYVVFFGINDVQAFQGKPLRYRQGLFLITFS